jgi:exodeoxyribonuclease VII large subunit
LCRQVENLFKINKLHRRITILSLPEKSAMTPPKNVDIPEFEGLAMPGEPVLTPGLTLEQAPVRDCMTVSQFVQAVSQQLARNFPLVRITGEISGTTRAASGHWYFTLKDQDSAVRCVLFKHRALYLGGQLRSGDQVEIRARAGLYEPRGEFQLVVDSVQAAGRGDLLAAFAALKEKLAAQGLFDAARKRALPVFPKRVGIVTSRDAAALRDVVTTFARRAPHVQLVLYPAAVQGAHAPRELLSAVQAASTRNETDVLIICRGGGSLEDLAAFNDEALAHAIAAAPVPVISGIGHETDFSISDFVADLRAPTPTAAAELAARATADWLSHLHTSVRQLSGALQNRLDTLSQRLDRAGAQLRHPGQTLALQRAQFTHLAQRLTASIHTSLKDRRTYLAAQAAALQQHRPQITTLRLTTHALAQRLHRTVMLIPSQRAAQLQSLAQRLTALDPTRVLARGYTYVTDVHGQPVTTAVHTKAGDALNVHWKDGVRKTTVVAD